MILLDYFLGGRQYFLGAIYIEGLTLPPPFILQKRDYNMTSDDKNVNLGRYTTRFSCLYRHPTTLRGSRNNEN